MESRTLSPSSDFILVYTAAKSKNKRALDGLIDNGICIDVHDERGLFTPAARLAAEGEDEAVELLKSYGANINPIAMGYASVGRLEKAEDLRKNAGASSWHFVVGSAMHSDHAYSDFLQAKYDLRAEWLVYGASLAGHHDYATLKMPNPADAEQCEKAACAKVKGLILYGETVRALAVLDEHQNDLSDILLRTAIEATARVKDTRFLDTIITRNGTKPLLLKYYYEIAAEGAAKGGHMEFAAALLQKSSGDKKAIEQAALSGIRYGHYHNVAKHFANRMNVSESAFLTHPVVLKGAICGFHHALRKEAEKALGFSGGLSVDYNDIAVDMARFGFIAVVAELFDKHRGIVPLDIVKAMDQGGYLYNEKLLQYALSFVHSNPLHVALNDAVLVLNSEIFKNSCYSGLSDCDRNALMIGKWMQQYHFDVDQAEAYVCFEELRNCFESLAANPNVTSQQFAASIDASKFDLSSDALAEMVETFKLYLAKAFVSDELKAYRGRHSFSLWQHNQRVESLENACSAAESREALRSLISYQRKLFKGRTKAAVDKDKPKHLQPLQSSIDRDDDCYQTVKKIVKDNRLK